MYHVLHMLLKSKTRLDAYGASWINVNKENSFYFILLGLHEAHDEKTCPPPPTTSLAKQSLWSRQVGEWCLVWLTLPWLCLLCLLFSSLHWSFLLCSGELLPYNILKVYLFFSESFHIMFFFFLSVCLCVFPSPPPPLGWGQEVLSPKTWESHVDLRPNLPHSPQPLTWRSWESLPNCPFSLITTEFLQMNWE